MASYPGSIVTFTENTNAGQTITSAYFNDPYNEIVAVETGLLNGFQHTIKWLTDNTYDIGASGANRPRNQYLAGFLAIGTNPAVSGSIRLPNATPIEARNAGNSADLQVAQYTASNVLQLGDAGAAAVELEQLVRAGTDASYDIGTASLRFRNLLLSGTIQNGTATMGITEKKGSGSGNYTYGTNAYTDVDGTNLAFTVTVPTGWKCTMFANGTVNSGTGTTTAFLALTDGTTLLKETELDFDTSSLFASFALSHTFSGDGGSHTFKLRWTSPNSATLTMLNSTATKVPAMQFILVPSN